MINLTDVFARFQAGVITEEEFRSTLASANQPTPSRALKPVLPEGFVDPAELHPAVHSLNQATTLTKRFSHFPTINAITALRDDGWEVFRGKGAPYIWTNRNKNGLDSGKTEDTGKHLVTLRHPDLTGAGIQRGDRFPQITIVNAHDGTSLLWFMAGIFELVCSNGMTSQRQGFSIGLPHRKLNVGIVVQKFRELAANLPIMIEQAQVMSEITLDRDQQLEFARASIPARGWTYEIDQKNAAGRIERIPNPYLPEPADLIRPAYSEQSKPTLWNTVQNVQRNLLQGGMYTTAKSDRSKTGVRKVRSVEGLELITQVNSYVDNMADEWARKLGADLPMPEKILEPSYTVLS